MRSAVRWLLGTAALLYAVSVYSQRTPWEICMTGGQVISSTCHHGDVVYVNTKAGGSWQALRAYKLPAWTPGDASGNASSGSAYGAATDYWGTDGNGDVITLPLAQYTAPTMGFDTFFLDFDLALEVPDGAAEEFSDPDAGVTSACTTPGAQFTTTVDNNCVRPSCGGATCVDIPADPPPPPPPPPPPTAAPAPIPPFAATRAWRYPRINLGPMTIDTETRGGPPRAMAACGSHIFVVGDSNDGVSGEVSMTRVTKPRVTDTLTGEYAHEAEFYQEVPALIKDARLYGASDVACFSRKSAVEEVANGAMRAHLTTRFAYVVIANRGLAFISFPEDGPPVIVDYIDNEALNQQLTGPQNFYATRIRLLDSYGTGDRAIIALLSNNDNDLKLLEFTGGAGSTRELLPSLRDEYNKYYAGGDMSMFDAPWRSVEFIPDDQPVAMAGYFDTRNLQISIVGSADTAFIGLVTVAMSMNGNVLEAALSSFKVSFEAGLFLARDSCAINSARTKLYVALTNGLAVYNLNIDDAGPLDPTLDSSVGMGNDADIVAIACPNGGDRVLLSATGGSNAGKVLAVDRTAAGLPPVIPFGADDAGTYFPAGRAAMVHGRYVVACQNSGGGGYLSRADILDGYLYTAELISTSQDFGFCAPPYGLHMAADPTAPVQVNFPTRSSCVAAGFRCGDTNNDGNLADPADSSLNSNRNAIGCENAGGTTSQNTICQFWSADVDGDMIVTSLDMYVLGAIQLGELTTAGLTTACSVPAEVTPTPGPAPAPGVTPAPMPGETPVAPTPGVDPPTNGTTPTPGGDNSTTVAPTPGDGNFTNTTTLPVNYTNTTTLPVNTTTAPVNATTAPPEFKDFPGVILTPTTLNLEEAEKIGERGAVQSYDITLSSAPVVPLNVTLSIPQSEQSQVDIQRDGDVEFFKTITFKFTPEAWGATPKVAVHVFALADGVAEGNHYASLQHRVNVSDAADLVLFRHNSLGGSTNVKLNLRDHASVSASLLFTPSGSLTINEGSNVTIQVSLSSRPDADVTVTFTVSADFVSSVNLRNGTNADPKLGGASSFTMRFTPEGFDAKQSMLISNQENSIAHGRRNTQLTIGVSSLNPVYAALKPDPVPLTLLDDSSAGINVSPSSGLVVREGSANGAKVSIALNTRPLATVQISFEEVDKDGNVVASELRGLDITPRTLTFTVSNWDEAQAVTLFGRADGVVRGNAERIVTLKGSSDDSSYVLTRTLSTTVEDVDTASLTVSSTEIDFEEGKFKRLDVSLGSKPLSEVSVVVGCTGSVATKDDAYCRDLASDAIAQPILAVATEPSDIASLDKTSTGLMLSYESFSTNSGRAYLAMPADGRCRVASNGVLGKLQIPMASVSSDSYYSGLTTNVTVTVTETDVARICWGATTCEQALTNQVIDGVLDTSITVRESPTPSSISLSFALQTIPISPVTIKLTPDDQLTVEPSSFTIDPSDYDDGDVPSGEFRVAAKDDLIEERMHTGKLSVTMTTDDPCYSVLEPVQLSVRIKDDELSAPVVRPIEVSEEKEVDFETDLGLTIKFPAAWLPVAKKGSVTDLNVNVTEMKPESVPKPIDVKVFSPQTIVSIRIEAIDSTDRFAAPVPLSIPISPSTNPELAAIVWSYGRSASDRWNVLENTIFDPATGTIKGLAEHFSIYVSTEVLPSVVITSTTSSLGDEPLVYTEDQPEALYPFDGANAVFEDGVTVLSEYICGLDVSLVNSNDRANALDGSEDQLAFGPSSESSAGAQGFSAFYNASNLVLYLRKGDADGSALADDPAKGSQCAGKASLVEYAKTLQMIRYRNPSQNPKNTGDNRALRVRVHEMHAKKTHTYPARIKVNSVNDPPTVQPSSNEMVYNEGTASRSLDGGLTIFDPEDHSLIRARVTIEPFDDTSDVFLFDSSNSAFEDGASLPTISKDSSNPSVGAYDISGAFPLLTYVNVLRSFKFKNDGPAIRFLKRTVTFRVEDVDGGVSNATRTLTIRERNDPPKAEDLALNVREDESVEGFGTNGMQATDPEGNKLTFRVVCPGSKGDLVLVNAQSGSFKYTPYPNEFGVDTIVYVARDDKGLDSNFATITVNIEATPDAPVANDAIYNNVFDGIDFVENLPVSDSDGDHDIKFIHIVVPPIYDKEAVQLTPAPGDSQNTDQTRQRGINPFRYFIKEDSETAKQEYDEFKYQVEDQGGALSNLATVKIYIKRQSQIVNQKPVLFPSDEYVREHGKIVFLINATDDRTKNLAFFYAGGSRPELGTLHSCDRTDAALPLKELCDGIVGPGDGSAGDPVEDTEFIGYGGKVVYSAKRHRHGVDAFSVVARDVQDKRSTPGELRIEVGEQNDVPVPACSTRSEFGGVPPTAFATQWRASNVTEALLVLPDTPADIDGVDAGKIHEEAALHFRDVHATGMLKTQNVDELSMLLPVELAGTTFDQPAAYTICNDTGSIVAISRPVPPKDDRRVGGPSLPPPGSRPPPPELHPQPVRKDTFVALLAFDPDEPTNGTLLYEIMDPPKMGNLTLVPRDELRVGAFEPSNVNFTVRQGEPIFMRFAAFEGVRGTDAFRWTARGRDLSSRGGFLVSISVMCPPGSIIDPGNETKCTPCEPGFYNDPDVFDQVDCYPCAEGTYNSKHGATQCELCPEGTYEPSQGMLQCTPCPHSNQTTPTGAKQQKECKCGLGYWQTWPETWAHLFPNLDPSGSGVCVPCDPERTVCDITGQRIPKPRSRKYFVNPKNAFDVATCDPEASCLRHRTTEDVLAGTCAVGYQWPGRGSTENVTGDACTECQQKYYRDNRLCKKCPKEAWLVFVVFGAVAVAIAPVLVKLAQASQGFSAVNIAISYFQVNATFRQFNFQWPSIVVDWFDFLAILNIDVAWLAPECLVSWSFLNKMAMIQAMPVLYMAIFGFNYAVYFVYILYQDWRSLENKSESDSDPQTPHASRSLKRKLAEVYSSAKAHAAADLGEHYGRVKSAFSLFLLWGYLIIGTVTFEYFNCSQVGDTWRMRVDPSVRCTWFPWIDESQRTRQGMHYRLAPVAVISFFLYPVGILVHFAWVLFSNRDVLKNRYMIESWLSDAKDELDKDFKKEKQEKEQKEEKEEKERRKSFTEIDVSMAKARGIFAWMTLWFTSFVTFTKHQEARSPFEVLRENDAKSEDLLSHTKVEAFKGESGEANVKNALRLRTLQVAYGFLFKRYESDYYWWEIMAFLRKLAIAAVRLLHNPLDQVVGVAAILLVNIAATAQCDPYEEQYLDYMELVALMCNLMILFSGYLFYSDLLSDNEMNTAGILIVLLMAGSIVAMVMWVLWDISPLIRKGAQLYLPNTYIVLPLVKFNPNFRKKKGSSMKSWIPFKIQFVQIRLGIYRQERLNRQKSISRKVNEKEKENVVSHHEVRRSEIAGYKKEAKVKLQLQATHSGQLLVASEEDDDPNDPSDSQPSDQDGQKGSSFVDVTEAQKGLAAMKVIRAFIMDPKTSKVLQNARATLNSNAYLTLKQWIEDDRAERFENPDAYDGSKREIVDLAMNLLFDALPTTFKDEVSKENENTLLRSIRKFAKQQYNHDQKHQHGRDGRSMSEADVQAVRFRRNSNPNIHQIPLVGGVIKNSSAENVWSYVCFEMGDVWILQPGARIVLPKGNRGVTLLGLPAGTEIQPPKHCEFATEDVPRKRHFVVRKGDRRRSLRVQGHATILIPSSLPEPIMTSLPVGTTVIDHPKVDSANDDQEGGPQETPTLKRFDSLGGKKSRSIAGLDAATRRKRLLAYLDRIHSQVEANQRSQYTSSVLEWEKLSSTMQRQSSSIAGKRDSTETSKNRVVTAIGRAGVALRTMMVTAMLGFLGFAKVSEAALVLPEPGWVPASADDLGIGAILNIHEDTPFKGNLGQAIKMQDGNAQMSALDYRDFQVACEPQLGTLNVTSGDTFTYTPFEDKFGEDIFSFQYFDQNVLLDTPGQNELPPQAQRLLVKVKIAPRNDAPLVDPTYEIPTSLVPNKVPDANQRKGLPTDPPQRLVHILKPESGVDADGDNLRYSIISPPKRGDAEIYDTNTLSYIPFAYVEDVRDALEYRVDDCGLGLGDANELLICNPETRKCEVEAGKEERAKSEGDNLPIGRECAFQDGQITLSIGSPVGLPPPLKSMDMNILEDAVLIGHLRRGSLPAELTSSDVRYKIARGRQPKHGKVEILCNKMECPLTQDGNVDDSFDMGAYRYTPDSHWSGEDSFAFGLVSSNDDYDAINPDPVAEVKIIVTPVNDAPSVLNDASLERAEEALGVLNVIDKVVSGSPEPLMQRPQSNNAQLNEILGNFKRVNETLARLAGAPMRLPPGQEPSTPLRSAKTLEFALKRYGRIWIIAEDNDSANLEIALRVAPQHGTLFLKLGENNTDPDPYYDVWTPEVKKMPMVKRKIRNKALGGQERTYHVYQAWFQVNALLRGSPLELLQFNITDDEGAMTVAQIPVSVPCSPGYHVSGDDNEVCTPCARGTFAPRKEMIRCSLCIEGYSSKEGSKACDPCPLNTYAEKKGTPKCSSCPANADGGGTSVTLTIGSTNRTACVCAPAIAPELTREYDEEGRLVSERAMYEDGMRGYYGSPGGQCLPCPGPGPQPDGKRVPEWTMCNSHDMRWPVSRSGFFVEIPRGLPPSPPPGMQPEIAPISEKVITRECFPTKACPDHGGDLDKMLAQPCGTGYDGIACSDCANDYYRFRGVCNECPENATAWFTIWVMILIAIAVPAAFRFSNMLQRMPSFNQIINLTQMIGVYGLMALNFVGPLKWIVENISIFNFDLALVHPGCVVSGFTWDRKWVGSLAFPLPFVAILLGNIARIWLTSKFAERYGTFLIEHLPEWFMHPGTQFRRSATKSPSKDVEGASTNGSGGGSAEEGKKDDDHDHDDNGLLAQGFKKVVLFLRSMAMPFCYPLHADDLSKRIRSNLRAALALAKFAFVPLTLTLVEFVDCNQDVSTGRYFLESEPTIECFVLDRSKYVWAEMLPVFIFFVIFYPVCLLGGFVWIMYSARGNLNSPAVKDVLGFITQHYNAKYYYFEVVSMVRRASVMITMVMFTGAEQSASMRQAVVSTLINFTTLIINQRTKPHRLPWLNRLEAGSQLTELLVLLTGLITLSRKTSNQFGYDMGLFTTIVTLAQYVCILFACVVEWNEKSGFIDHQQDSVANIMREMRKSAAKREHKYRQYEKLSETLVKKAKKGNLNEAYAYKIIAKILRDFAPDEKTRNAKVKKLITFFPVMTERVEELLNALHEFEKNSHVAEAKESVERCARDVKDGLHKVIRGSASKFWAVVKAHEFARMLLARRGAFRVLTGAAIRQSQDTATSQDVFERKEIVLMHHENIKTAESDEEAKRLMQRLLVDLSILLRTIDKLLSIAGVRGNGETDGASSSTKLDAREMLFSAIPPSRKDIYKKWFSGEERSKTWKDFVEQTTQKQCLETLMDLKDALEKISTKAKQVEDDAFNAGKIHRLPSKLRQGTSVHTNALSATTSADAESGVIPPLSRFEASRCLEEINEINKPRQAITLTRGGSRPVHHALEPKYRTQMMESLARSMGTSEAYDKLQKIINIDSQLDDDDDDVGVAIRRGIDTACEDMLYPHRRRAIDSDDRQESFGIITSDRSRTEANGGWNTVAVGAKAAGQLRTRNRAQTV